MWPPLDGRAIGSHSSHYDRGSTFTSGVTAAASEPSGPAKALHFNTATAPPSPCIPAAFPFSKSSHKLCST